MQPSDSSYSPRWALTHTKVSSEIFIFSPLEGNKKEDSFKKCSEKETLESKIYLGCLPFSPFLTLGMNGQMPVNKCGSANLNIALIAPPTHKVRIHKYLPSHSTIARR